MIVVYTGIPGSGKSQKMALLMVDVLYRNKKWFEKSGIKRKIVSNMKLNNDIEKEFDGFIEYWSDIKTLISYRDCDVFWDEIATDLDSTQWQNMSLNVKRWLQQHRKFGTDIYGTTQDFGMVDKSFRRMVEGLFILNKLVGSRDKSATRPTPKYIWGVVAVRSVDVKSYEKDANNPEIGFLPSFLFINRETIEIFDTTQEIKQSEFLPLNHTVRKCCMSGCDFTKVVHA